MTIRYYLAVDGVKGDSTILNGWFDIDAVTFGAAVGIDETGHTAGVPNLFDLSVALEGVAPDLIARLTTGTAISAVRVQGMDDVTGEIVYDIRMGHVFITGNAIGAGGGTPSTSLSFHYDQIGVITPSESFGYDKQTHTQIDPESMYLPVIGATGGPEDAAAAHYYLIIDGVPGVATTSKGWFEISSLSFGANLEVSETGIPGHPDFSGLSVNLAGVAPALFTRLANATALGAVRIEGVDSKGAIIYDLRLNDVYVTASAVSAGDSGAPSTSLTFDYAKIGLITANSSFGFNVATNAAINPNTLSVPSTTISGAGVAPEAVHYYLALDGIKGGSTSLIGWFDLSSVSFGASATGGGATDFGDISVMTEGVTPELLAKLATGQGITSARIQGVDGKGGVLYEMRLGDVHVMSENIAVGSEGTPVTALSLDYNQIGVITPVSNFGFNLTTNSSMAASTIAIPTVGTSGGAEIDPATKYYLIIDGANGGSATLKGAFDIYSLSLGATDFDGPAQDTSFSSLNVVLGGVTPLFMAELMTGPFIDSARIEGIDSKGAVVYDLRLGDVNVSSVNLSASGEGVPITTMSLDYRQIGLITQNSSFGFNLVTETAIDATAMATPSPSGSVSNYAAPEANYYLIVEGINGGTPAAASQIEVLALSFGGDRSLPWLFGDVSATIEGVSPDFMDILANGSQLSAVRIEGVDYKGAIIYDLRLNDVFVSSSATGASAGGGSPVTSLSFQFETIGLITPFANFGYDLTTDTAVSAQTLAVPMTGTLAAPEARLASRYYLAIDGITEDTADFNSWIEIDALSFSSSLPSFGGVAGQPAFSDIAVLLNATSPDVLTMLTSGTASVAARILGVNNTGTVFYDVRLGDVLISSVSFSGSTGSAATSITLDYQKIAVVTPVSSFGYDTVTNDPIDPDDIYTLGDTLTLGAGGVSVVYDGTQSYHEIIGGSGADTLTVDLPSTGTTAAVTASVDGTKILIDINGDGVTDLTVSGVEALVLNGRLATVSGNLSGTGLSANGLIFNGAVGGDSFIGGGVGGTSLLVQGNTGADTLTSGSGHDTLSGGDGADLLEGNAGNDSLLGGARWDTLRGADGNDTLDGGLDNDQMYGGKGSDLYYVDHTGDRTYEAVNEGNDTVVSSISLALMADLDNLTLTGVSNLTGTGNGLANRITGNDGANTLSGGASADTIDGGLGADSIDGGIGNDSLLGGGRWDTIYGGDGNDTMDGGLDNDQMYGGLGDDVYYLDNSGDRVNESTVTNEGFDVVFSSVTWNMSANVETVTFTGAANASSTGNSLHNTMTGNTGNNTLIGGLGHDTINGGDGHDAIDGGIDSDVLDGGNGNDTVVGGQRWDTLTGGAGDDLIDGGTENDRMTGNAGNDTYYIDHIGDRVFEVTGEGTDVVHTSIDWAMASEIENLFLIGAAITGTGNGLNNRIAGNGSSNVLGGGNGNDTITGGVGNDTITGGTGRDDFVFAAAASNGTDHVTDFVHSIDRLVFKGSDYGFAAGAVLTAAQFTAGASAVGTSAQFIWDAGTGHLYWDADGTGAGARMDLALLAGGPVVTKEDLYFTA